MCRHRQHLGHHDERLGLAGEFLLCGIWEGHRANALLRNVYRHSVDTRDIIITPTSSPEESRIFLDYLASFGKNASHTDGHSGFVFEVSRFECVAIVAIEVLREALRTPLDVVSRWLCFVTSGETLGLRSLSKNRRRLLHNCHQWVCFCDLVQRSGGPKTFAKRSGHRSAMPRRGFVCVISHLPTGLPQRRRRLIWAPPPQHSMFLLLMKP
jgi:hypothetical protein